MAALQRPPWEDAPSRDWPRRARHPTSAATGPILQNAIPSQANDAPSADSSAGIAPRILRGSSTTGSGGWRDQKPDHKGDEEEEVKGKEDAQDADDPGRGFIAQFEPPGRVEEPQEQPI